MQDPQHKSIRKRPLIVAGLLAVLVAAASIAFSRGVILPPNWPDFTGFQNKTLWDWLTLAVVPMTAAAVGILYSSYEKDRDVRREQEREKDIANRQQDTDLQDYFDRINGINDKGLNDSAEHSALRNAARFLTINTLKRLDQVHRRRLIRFLYDGLFIVNWQKVASGEDHFCPETAISLIEADFSQTDLSSEWLSGANLNGAILRQAILKGAKLPWVI